MKEPKWLLAITTLGCFALAVSGDSMWWRVNALILGIFGVLKFMTTWTSRR